MQNTVAICRYGTERTLTYARKYMGKDRVRNTVRTRNSIGKILSYEIDGKLYKVLGPGGKGDVCSLNDGTCTTYWEICPRTKTIIGQY